MDSDYQNCKKCGKSIFKVSYLLHENTCKATNHMQLQRKDQEKISNVDINNNDQSDNIYHCSICDIYIDDAEKSDHILCHLYDENPNDIDTINIDSDTCSGIPNPIPDSLINRSRSENAFSNRNIDVNNHNNSNLFFNLILNQVIIVDLTIVFSLMEEKLITFQMKILGQVFEQLQGKSDILMEGLLG